MITGPDVTVRGLDIDSFAQGAGIHLTGTGATDDSVYGNFVGTDPTGMLPESNQDGVEIDAGASGNVVGAVGGVEGAAETNVVSGNTEANVLIDGAGTDGNVVAGDWIGTTVTGDAALPNARRPYGPAGSTTTSGAE